MRPPLIINIKSNFCEKYINSIDKANGKVTISDVFYKDNRPLLTITVPTSKGYGDIYYIDLSQLQNLLADVSTKGSYLELKDATNRILFSNKVEGNLVPITNTFKIDDKHWSLTGYIDIDYIENQAQQLNRKIMVCMLIIATLLVVISLFVITLTFKPITRLRDVINELSQGNTNLTTN